MQGFFAQFTEKTSLLVDVMPAMQILQLNLNVRYFYSGPLVIFGPLKQHQEHVGVQCLVQGARRVNRRVREPPDDMTNSLPSQPKLHRFHAGASERS